MQEPGMVELNNGDILMYMRTYLQGKMPSPVDGIFIAEVKIGDIIKEGDLFGRAIESQTGERVD